MDIFLFKLLLTFIVGGIWLALSTIIGEKYGTKLGGILVGFPSTSLIALFFMGWTQTPKFAAEATILIPIIAGVNAIFVIIYLQMVKRSFSLALLLSLGFWSILSIILVLINFDNFLYSIIGLVILGSLSYYFFEKKFRIRSEGMIKINYTFSLILFRATFGGFMIALAVFLAKIGGHLVGSVFSMFPALFLSTIFITHFSHGTSFSAAMMKSSVFSANINIPIYGIAVRYLYPAFGLILGTILSLIVALITGYLTYVYIKKKMS